MAQPDILLIGRHGQVATELQKQLPTLGCVTVVGSGELDLADVDSIRRVVREARPNLIVNAAAYTAVDKAESEPELALAINATAPGVLAEEARRLDAALVHYSTDYVFDGAKTTPYLETDTPHPLNVYGRTKLLGEQAIQGSGARHLIFRTTWVYGPHGRNFLLTMLRLAKERESLRVVNDQFGAPTSSHSIAVATAQVLRAWQGESGLYHLSCGGKTSWFGFAEEILREYAARQAGRHWPPLKADVDAVAAITSTEYPTPAQRPINSVLDNTRLNTTFQISLPEWREALVQVMEHASFRE